MECKKCKKECLESELKNGVCQECMTKGKNPIIKAVVISVVLSFFVTLGIEIWANNDASLSDFKVESFDMETEKTSYTYSDDSVSYSGKGTISCKNKITDYIVLVERKNKTSNETDYIPVVIHNGTGNISTYDSSYSGATQKPEYEFNIIGYRTFKK